MNRRVSLDEQRELVGRWKRAKAAVEHASRELRRIESELKAHLGDADAGTIGGQAVVCQDTDALQGLDLARLRDENPELLRQYPMWRTRTHLKRPPTRSSDESLAERGGYP